MYRDALERQREVLGPEHASTQRAASRFATAMQNQGKFSEAEPVLRDTLAIQQRVLGEGDLITRTTACSLATLLSNAGQHTEAEAPDRGALAQAKRTLGPDHPTSRTLAITLSELGQAAKAEATLATQQRVLGRGHIDTQTTVELLRRFQQRG